MALLLATSLALGNELEDLLKGLREAQDDEERLTIYIQIAYEAGKKDAPRIVKEIEISPANLRWYLVLVLGRLQALAELRTVALKYDPLTTAVASTELRRLGDEIAGRNALLSTLERAKKPEHKNHLLWRLHPRWFTGPEVVAGFFAFLDREKGAKLTWEEEAPRRVAIRMLSFHEDKRIDPYFRKLVDGREMGMWGEALAALALRRVPGALDELLGILESGKLHENDGWAVARSLRLLGQREAQERIRALLATDAKPEVKIPAIRILRWSQDYRSLAALAAIATEAKGTTLGAEAAEAAAELAVTSDIPMLQKLVEGAEPRVQFHVGRALLRLDDPRGFDILMTLVKDDNRDRRLEVVRAVAGRADARAVDVLLEMIEDPDKDIAKAARDGLIRSWSFLYPYRDFDAKATPDEYRRWWKTARK